jgi:hypothetical protein
MFSELLLISGRNELMQGDYHSGLMLRGNHAVFMLNRSIAKLMLGVAVIV